MTVNITYIKSKKDVHNKHVVENFFFTYFEEGKVMV